jgi:hypothetical protein
MDLQFKSSGGTNLVFRPGAQARYLPIATAQAACVEVYWKFPEELPAAARLIGVFPPVISVSTHYSPDKDRDVHLAAVTVSTGGVRNPPSLDEAEWVLLSFQRETEAPVIGLTETVNEELAVIGVKNFSRYARERRVTVSANADMSDPLRVEVFNSDAYTSRELPRFFELKRTLGSGTLDLQSGGTLNLENDTPFLLEVASAVLPETVFVSFSHSGGNGWTPESNILEVKFAGSDGTPGSDGDFNPIPRDELTINTL